MAVYHLTKDNFDETIARGKSMVDFWASWCGPCKMLSPIIEAVAEKQGDAVKVCKVDIDAEPELANRFGILTIPTVIIFEDGEEVTRSIGVRPQAALEALL
ncbi:MAG: thioredoxin [Firmicutes bacterium]|nr:thioredoxin [Bacillota bacterium]